MAAPIGTVTTPITFLCRVGDSEVLNEIGSIDLTVEVETIVPGDHKPGEAYEARLRVVDFDLVKALRDFADGLEASREG